MTEPTTHDRVQLVICLSPPPDPERLRRISEISGTTAYDLRLRLKGDLPRPVASYESIEAAEAKAAQLNVLDVTTIVYAKGDLPMETPFAVFTLGLTESELHCAERRGETMVVLKSELALIVLGRRVMTQEVIDRDIAPVTGATMGPPLVFPGITVSKHTREDTLFAVLFRRDLRAPALLLEERGVDYSSLGDRRERTHAQSLRQVVADLREAMPDVPLDDRLLKGQSGNRGEGFYNRRLLGESSCAYATLIYWQMLAEQGGRRHITVRREGRG